MTSRRGDFTNLNIESYHASLILYNNINISIFSLFEYCQTTTIKTAAENLHLNTRTKLNTDLTFYIRVTDKNELILKYYECKFDGKVYTTIETTKKEILKVFKSNNVLKYFSEHINNLINKNKNELFITLLKQVLKDI